MSVYILATLDTKGTEADWVRTQLVDAGLSVTLVDTGCLGEPIGAPDISRQQLFQSAEEDWQEHCARRDRGAAVAAAARGAVQVVRRAYDAGRLDGVIGLGGSAGTTIATAAMRSLPLGIPKLMISTLASGDVQGFVGSSDIFMLHSVVDIAGLNRISLTVLGQAVAAMTGLVLRKPKLEDRRSTVRPLVAATMFGVTTPCVERARQELEAAGYEVLVFHATGSGGRAMETLIRDGWIEGVLDITTTELADHQVGGVMSAGPERLTAAAERGVPQVVSVGATDMVNFWAMETVPPPFRTRRLHAHNPQVTLMRTTADECARIGAELASKVAAARGPAHVLLPQRGVSALDQAGQSFDDETARQSLFAAIQNGLPANQVTVIEAHINDPEFAIQAARRLLELMKGKNAK